MPRLVGLELGSIFEEPGYRTQHPTLVELIGSGLPPPSLDFPILSSFRAFGTSSPAYIQLLAQMTFQPQFSLNLTYKPWRYNSRDLVLALQILNRAIRNSSMTIRTVRCYSADNPAHNVICFMFSFDPRLGSPFVTFTVEVVLLPWHSFNYGRWLRELALFPLDDVKFLSTEGLSRLDSWTDNLFTGLSNLRRLQLLDHGDVLLVFLISDSNLTTGTIAFPALEELEIHDIHFPIELKSALPRCFIARETRYARLRELTFVGCKVTDAAAKKLEGQVDKLRRISIEAHQQEQRLHS
ncbi:hypothetical protein BDN72DRAFT_209174 [Pluteus cervinus]|uniref:Uncharacterized protein n=1 Tax=Pluteus cervinus TaxID=181527 RepID=A0ACD3AHE3_9AGAR|nr:hypothetical protein BDN72DRAFT_209174 [Pluteus cervinus]